MEIYSVRVKRSCDGVDGGVLPSERRYSARTVAGLGWVHAALAITAALLALLALLAPQHRAARGGYVNDSMSGDNYAVDASTSSYYNANMSDDNSMVNASSSDYVGNASMSGSNAVNASMSADNYTFTESAQDEWSVSDSILVAVPALVCACGVFCAGAATLASVRWYEDAHISWLLAASCVSSLLSLAACATVLVWSSDGLADFYKDHEPFAEYIAVRKDAILEANSSHILVQLNANPRQFSRRVLCINILIAAALEALWSLLSVHISYKGSRAEYSSTTPPPRPRVLTELRGKAYESEGKERVLNFLQRCDSSTQGSLRPIPESTPPEPSWGDTPPHPVYTQDTLDLQHIFARNNALTAPQS